MGILSHSESRVVGVAKAVSGVVSGCTEFGDKACEVEGGGGGALLWRFIKRPASPGTGSLLDKMSDAIQPLILDRDAKAVKFRI